MFLNVLEQLFSGTNISYKVLDKSIILSPKEVLVAQQKSRKITGVVTDGKGEPVPGANVIQRGTTNGTISDIDGKFSLEVPDNATLVISFIGYVTKNIAVGHKEIFNITLLEDSRKLDEVVVTALGIKREEKALGYAVQKVKGDNLPLAKTVDVTTSLTGKVAGLNIQNSTEFNETPKIKLRGETPLIIVDGVPYGNITLDEIASDDIESIDVLKGATASALYGARGTSGAIMITTKKGANEEGLNININKDFEKHYKDDAWRGFTLKEVCCMLLFLILLFGMVFFCWKWLHMQPDLAVYLAVPFGLPVLCVGFFEVSRDDTSRACKRNGI